MKLDDKALGDAYREASRNSLDGPPTHLDDAIRAAARRTVRARPQAISASWATRYRAPIALAATVMLALGVAINVRDTGEGDPAPKSMPQKQTQADAAPVAPVAPVAPPQLPVPAQDASRDGAGAGASSPAPPAASAPPQPLEKRAPSEPRSAPAPAPKPAMAESKAKSETPAEPNVVGSAATPPAAEAPRANVESKVASAPPIPFPASPPAPAPAAPPAPSQPSLPSAPAPSARDVAEAPQAAAPALSSDVARARRQASPAPVTAPAIDAPPPQSRAATEAMRPPPGQRAETAPAAPASAGQRLAQNEADRSPEVRDRWRPEQWVEEVRRLRQNGRMDEAMKTLDELKRRFPAFELPVDLRL